MGNWRVKSGQNLLLFQNSNLDVCAQALELDVYNPGSVPGVVPELFWVCSGSVLDLFQTHSGSVPDLLQIRFGCVLECSGLVSDQREVTLEHEITLSRM